MSEQQATPTPPATFEFLVGSIVFQTQMALGIIRMTEEDSQDLNAARHFIDLLAMLEAKTKGNLTLEEERLLSNSLTELRFRFVQSAGEASQGANAGA